MAQNQFLLDNPANQTSSGDFTQKAPAAPEFNLSAMSTYPDKVGTAPAGVQTMTAPSPAPAPVATWGGVGTAPAPYTPPPPASMTAAPPAPAPAPVAAFTLPAYNPTPGSIWDTASNNQRAAALRAAGIDPSTPAGLAAAQQWEQSHLWLGATPNATYGGMSGWADTSSPQFAAARAAINASVEQSIAAYAAAHPPGSQPGTATWSSGPGSTPTAAPPAGNTGTGATGSGAAGAGGSGTAGPGSSPAPAPGQPGGYGSTGQVTTGGNIPAQLTTDWNAFWAGAAPGSSRPWSGGTLTRNADGSATYRSSDGRVVQMTQGMDLTAFAQQYPEVAQAWSSLYGWAPPQAANGTTLPSVVPGTTSTNGAPSFGSLSLRGANTWNVDGNQTVAGQLAQVLNNDSPLMQQARARALQRANASGLANSSLAATAGEAAMIDAGMPIAQQDASTYANSAQFNAGARNTFDRDYNQVVRDRDMASFNLSANDWAGERGLSREQRLQATRASTDASSQDNTLKRGYMNAINQARTDYGDKLAAISSNKDMDSSVKAEALRNLRVTYNTLIRNYSRMLGWDENSWLIQGDDTMAPAPAPAPATNPGAGGSDGAGGGGGD